MSLVERLRAALARADRDGLLPGDLIEGHDEDAHAGRGAGRDHRPAEPGLILTVRRETFADPCRPGRLSRRTDRPGRRCLAAALREAYEELALNPAPVTSSATPIPIGPSPAIG